jgi:hypothetical protein
VTTSTPGRLRTLPLSRATLDRAAERRGDDLLPALLTNPATRVLEVSSARARVAGDPPALVLRPPEPEDAERVAVFLGQEPDGAGPATDHVAVGVQAPESEAPDSAWSDAAPHEEGWAGLRQVGGL